MVSENFYVTIDKLMIYDLAIIGGGPAGNAAGVYAARKQLKTVFLTTEFGGQSIVSPEIYNWIGEQKISGEDLAKKLADHVKSYEGDFLTIKTGSKVSNVTDQDSNFTITTESGEVYQAKTILVATGSNRRKLTVPGAAEFDQKGLTYCASCDGPLFAGQDVAVLGGGNAAFETAGQLLAYCKSVTLIHRSADFRADQITIDTLLKKPNFKIVINAELAEIKGDKFVSSLTYKNKETAELTELPVKGIFVEIGHTPNTSFVKDLVDLTSFGAIIIDHKTQKSSCVGIWAAGDCTDALYQQNNIATGDAIKAVEDIYNYLHLK